MTETDLLAGVHITLGVSDTESSSCISSHDCESRFTDDKSSVVCEFHFGSCIKRTVFAQQFPWLWDRTFLWAVKLSGSLTVETLKWEHIQMKQWDVWKAPSTRECRVTHLLWPQGLLNCSAAQSLIHTHTQTNSRFVPNTLWCSLHLSPWWMMESLLYICVNMCVYQPCAISPQTLSLISLYNFKIKKLGFCFCVFLSSIDICMCKFLHTHKSTSASLFFFFLCRCVSGCRRRGAERDAWSRGIAF